MKAFAFGGPLNLTPFALVVRYGRGHALTTGYGHPTHSTGASCTRSEFCRFYRTGGGLLAPGALTYDYAAYIRRIIALGGAR